MPLARHPAVIAALAQNAAPVVASERGGIGEHLPIRQPVPQSHCVAARARPNLPESDPYLPLVSHLREQVRLDITGAHATRVARQHEILDLPDSPRPLRHNPPSEHLPEVREHRPPPPLWRARQAGATPEDDSPDPRGAVAQLLQRLFRDGYFAKRLPSDCVDDEPDEWGQPIYQTDPEHRLRDYLRGSTLHQGRELEL
jgi:hypothetical protein